MKAIMLMFDSLRRDMLSPYGNKETITPNFQRLAEKTCQFNNCFVGSMPCMPARRDIQTGRYNFLHRSWGPMEPFDNSFPEILKKAGIYTHLVTDHKHYWREGGATYHPKFNSYELVRGQEGDAWKGDIDRADVECDFTEPDSVSRYKSKSRMQDLVNRKYMEDEIEHPLCKTINSGIDFLNTNKESDNYFLQIECFDPHEPFFVPQNYLDMYDIDEVFNGWPPYYYDNLDDSTSKKINNYYKALITMCDEYVGKLLDVMDDNNMWEDTMLIVTTDHGFLLGEHEWWGKNIMPLYNEVANIPFFFYSPNQELPKETDVVTQNIDICPTILNYFNQQIPSEVQGKDLINLVLEGNRKEGILFGNFGANINICYEDYIYMRSPKNKNIDVFEYTLMPTHINSMFSVEELKSLVLSNPFDFTKGLKTMKIKGKVGDFHRFSKKLFSLTEDRKQMKPIYDTHIEFRMIEEMLRILKKYDAPQEIYDLYDLNNITTDILEDEQNNYCLPEPKLIEGIQFENIQVLEGYITFVENYHNNKPIDQFKNSNNVTVEELVKYIHNYISLDKINEVMYRINLSMRLS